MSFEQRSCPIFINCRDRVTDLKALVAWLEQAGHERITLIDNNSSYEPLLDYYRETPHEVVYLRQNLGSRAIWRSGLTPLGEYWVYTDPDVVPMQECPPDAVTFLYELLQEIPYPKAGLGLYLGDTPDFQSKTWEYSLVSVERQMFERRGYVPVYDSLVDTSFALHRPGAGHTLSGLRTGLPYNARHMSWYFSGRELDEENRYYLAHCNDSRDVEGALGSSWKEGRQV